MWLWKKKPAILIFLLVAVTGFSILLPLPASANTGIFGEWQSQLLQDVELYGVWGSSSSNVFAIGKDGTILHYNGNTWGHMNSGTSNHLYSIWGSSSSDVFAVGEDGIILHYNGSTWGMNSGTSNAIWGIWGTSSTDVFAVGGAGTILHYNGTTWSIMSSGTYSFLYSVWGTSSSDVFAVGDYGTILHYNGNSWNTMSSGTESYLYSIWGSSSSDVFAVGEDGIILHYNGDTWSNMRRGTTNSLHGVWGFADNDVFAVGYYGTILHYNGSTWSRMHSDTTHALHGVWGTSHSNVFSSDVFAVGYGIILHNPRMNLSQILPVLIITGIIGLIITVAVIVVLVYFLRKRKSSVQPAPSTGATMTGTGKLSKKFFWGSYVGSLIPFLIIQLITAIAISRYWHFDGLIHGLENTDTMEIPQMPLWLTLLSSLNALLSIYLTVVSCIFIYRAWKSIQDGHARASAGKALGFLFIPVFNYYWIFQAVWGFAIDFNKYVHRNNVNSVPRLPERLFLAFCVVYIISIVLGFIMGFLGLLFGYPSYFYITWVPTAAYYIIGAVIINKVCDAVNALPPLMFRDVDSQRWEVGIREEQSAMRKAVVAEERLTVSKPSMEGRMIENTSGMGSSASIPIEIKGWNWGAFLLSWIWGVSHSVWISLLCFIPFGNVVMVFVLGANGNKWAWQNRRWDSIEHFQKTQRTWAWWGLGVVIAGIVLYIILFAIMLAAPAD